MAPDLIVHNAQVATNAVPSLVEAASIQDGRIQAIGGNADVLRTRGPETQVIDARGRTVIPGLIDSHMHPIRGGLHYNMELRWEGVRSLTDALRMLRAQAARTPAPQWVRVVGGWSEFQFQERRMPTLDEINQAAPDTPVFVLHLYAQALLNRAALAAAGYTKDTPDPPGGQLERDRHGNPTGLLVAKPNAAILYSTLARGPKLSYDDQLNSTRQFMRELNRLGVTSVVDAGGGFQNYPDDYRVVNALHDRNELTVRIAYNLFTQKSGAELADFKKWSEMTIPGAGDDYLRVNGAGEMLVYSAADFEDFLEPRPDLPLTMERDLKAVVRYLAERRWPFRLHTTYDETITRVLNTYEEVHREVPLTGLHWFLDHCETISDRNIERVKALGGGIAIQSRMAFQGEHFLRRYGSAQAQRTPPIRRMLESGIPVGAGTDATRVSSYNPFVALYWLITGKTVGGTELYPQENRLSREEALRLYTVGSSWFSSDQGRKGALTPGQLADFSVLSGDFFSVPEDEIKSLESLLTIVGGRVVYAAQEFKNLDRPPLPVSPEWSPLNHDFTADIEPLNTHPCIHGHEPVRHSKGHSTVEQSGFWPTGCACAFG